ncbi:hypothetical protein GCM10007977_107520 [Dactylosporangium sucinum]|uniref:Uncharacterized protein n=1 Tax=Dactylosporangium sucinum TaxID=1424081 RepID=A0A917UHL4_9ACTN|nr:hypothetical protein GCM10007977_107520 [Dactylosporangium sucinum]
MLYRFTMDCGRRGRRQGEALPVRVGSVGRGHATVVVEPPSSLSTLDVGVFGGRLAIKIYTIVAVEEHSLLS